MKYDLTTGPVAKTMLKFSIPMILGDLFQQLYNISDTLIVGWFIGTNALAAVGASYTLIIFLTSVILGLCMGSGALFSIFYGEKNFTNLKSSIFLSFILISIITIIINILIFTYIDEIIVFMRIPQEIYDLAYTYLHIIFIGFSFTFIYNYFTCLLRAIGNSNTPLLFLGFSAILNIILSLVFVAIFNMGVSGSAIATVISQGLCALGLILYTALKCPELMPQKEHMRWNFSMLKNITNSSILTCTQQSVMNFGILMVQGLVNSFGPTVMAAFTVAVKIDSLAYMPAQDFGNAFSTFIGQNFGAKQTERIRQGIKTALKISFVFCLIISIIVIIFAKSLMTIFVDANEIAIIEIGAQYLYIEGSCYFGIGFLFLLYGFYRAINFPMMSVILTIISLGTRVFLAYYLASIPSIGVIGIWWSIPIGWALADIFGFVYYKRKKLHLIGNLQ